MSGDLSGFSMFELFKTEAETHSASLSEGLLAIEANPEDLSHTQELMRAAHSLKGAARIVGLDAVVELAHAMEDCFVAVQNKEQQLDSARIDQLLRGVDLFQALAQLPEEQVSRWLETHGPDCLQLGADLRCPVQEANLAVDSAHQSAGEPLQVPESIGDGSARDRTTPASAESLAELSPDKKAVEREQEQEQGQEQEKEREQEQPVKPAAESAEGVPPLDTARPGPRLKPPEQTSSVVTPAEQPVPATVATSPSDTESGPEDPTVAVNASNLNQIMRLAGESMIESQRLQSMRDSLTALRDVQRHISSLVDQVSADRNHNGRCRSGLMQIREFHRKAEQLLQEHSAHLEQALWRAEQTSTALYHQVIGSRMRPFSDGTKAFPRMIRDLARSLGKAVSFQVRGGSVAVDRDILRKLEAPLNHILRNCVDHGLEPPRERRAAGKPEKGQVVLEARHHAGMLTVEVRDDGRGIDLRRLRRRVVERKLATESMAASLSEAELLEFLFLPGFSTAREVTEVSGRGVGLDVVRTMVQEVSGTVRVHSQPGQGTTFRLHLPVTLSVIRAALAEIAGEPYAFPLSKLVRIIRVPVAEIRPVQGRQQLMLDGQSVGLVNAAEILDLTASGSVEGLDEQVGVMVIGQSDQPCGLIVDRFIGEQDLVVRPLDPRLGKVPHLLAAAVTESGESLLIVDIDDLLQAVRQLLGEGRLRGMTSLSRREAHAKRKVLVVDDSITVREVERQLLAGHGYEVDVAVDGQDGWHALCAETYDLLVTDVDMPRINGIELIRQARRDPRFAELPIIIVSYKDREEDRMLGFEAGANAYLTKGSFHDDSFVTTVTDLIGDAD